MYNLTILKPKNGYLLLEKFHAGTSCFSEKNFPFESWNASLLLILLLLSQIVLILMWIKGYHLGFDHLQLDYY